MIETRDLAKAYPGGVCALDGLSFEVPAGVDRDLTGRDNLELQGRLQDVRGRALEQRANALLEEFGLADVADRVSRTYFMTAFERGIDYS